MAVFSSVSSGRFPGHRRALAGALRGRSSGGRPGAGTGAAVRAGARLPLRPYRPSIRARLRGARRAGAAVSAILARAVVRVAVGVVLRADRAVLLADRPGGKAYAGYWEFPGGKIENAESVEHALARELAEELRITLTESVPWLTFDFDYPHAYVRLYFRRVIGWHGTPTPLEGPRLMFHRPGAPAPDP